MKMTSCKPYLVRAIYDWIMENKCTPYLLVDAEFPGVQVPFEFVKDGQIVLNISAGATGGLMLGDDVIEFNARFGGEPRHLIVPLSAVLFIYAKENGEGMPFPPEPKPEVSEQTDEPSLTSVEGTADSNDTDDTDKKRDKTAKVSHLKVIK